MKKKSSAGSRATPAKIKKKLKVTTQSGQISQMNTKPSGTNAAAEEAAVVHAYQDGLRALQERKFERAKGLFQKVVNSGMQELADRARVHLNTCRHHLDQAVNASTVFRSPEEHYDYAVSLINLGDYIAAGEHLEKILKQTPKADYAWYGLAVLHCLTGHFEDSLRGLSEAIRLNPANRFQARNDSDFNDLADDPRFTELLYPENEMPSGGPSGPRR